MNTQVEHTEDETVRREIRFLLNGAEVRLHDVGASDTLLDFLRNDRRLKGTKEGCAEGDCGACTVLVGRMVADASGDRTLRYETVNACIRFLASVDGSHVVTVEHLASRDGTLHPVQQAMVDCHGSQCGFCTPGFVMSLYALWMENPRPSVDEVETALQGNLCRCTGYEPIVRAALAAAEAGGQDGDILAIERTEVLERLSGLRDGRRVEVSRRTEGGSNGDAAILPADVADLSRVLEDFPDATIVAGATDVGLWVTKFMRNIGPAVFINHLDELKTITVDESAVTLGAGVSYSEFEGVIEAHFPRLMAYWRRIGGWQVRNMGTIGGNIANGSPIGDTPPILIALGTEITLQRGEEIRTLPLEDFFIDYGKQDRQAGDFLSHIRIPLPNAGADYAAYKISKRRDEDISAVCMGIAVSVDGDAISDVRIAFGGMAATPKRARNAEAVLRGMPWSESAVRAAMAALAEDFEPISDWRASGAYRARVAANLLMRFHLERTGDTSPDRLSA